MYSTIKNLWYGNISPHEEIYNNKRLKKLYKNLEMLEEDIKQLIKDKFKVLDDIYTEIIDEYQVNAFVKGFNLALKFTTEAYAETEE